MSSTDIIKVDRLCKAYPSFSLDNVSLTVEKGKIVGFIGRNGAGKTTTIKSMLGFIHPESGSVAFFGKDFSENELDVKQNIGYVSGGFGYYPNKKIRNISAVTSSFYDNWDSAVYEKYMTKFKIDDSKTPSQLSEGMKVKYSIVLALSHQAQLLILDEPTSGIDPVSREEILDIFLDLQESGVTVFFSTHITSDLEKCADDIVYIQNGRIISSGSMKSLVESYKTVSFTTEQYELANKSYLIGAKRTKEGYAAIVKSENSEKIVGSVRPSNLETIMLHLEKEREL